MSTMVDNCPIQIAVRQRPVRENQKENCLSSSNVVSFHSVNSNILIADERPFAFDHVLSPDVSQKQLFDELIKPLVAKVLQGFNCTALAYGQTGTGKSYTMGLNSNPIFEGDNVGVIPRCLQEMLVLTSNSENSEQEQRQEIWVSFIEIYNEKVYDLLVESNCTEPIASRCNKFTGGIRKRMCSIQDCYSILSQGNKNRHVRPTKLNSQSSRSHAIFTIHGRFVNEEDNAVVSCLNLVDLAGSEGVRRTGHQGVAMSEGVHINQGLLSIGKVLQALTMGNKVIPYRDSVLSSVLQDSLSSNSYLTLLACISPHREDLSETLSTLRFAQNAKQLKHTPQINTLLAEIKKTKVKTPYALKTMQNKNMRATTTPYKRTYSSVAPIVKSGNKNLGYHSNTFCTPHKMQKIGSNKLNQSELGLTPKEKQKMQNKEHRALTLRYTAPRASNNGETNRELFFDRHNDTLDSRSSLFSLNVSTSTTVDAPISQAPNSYSPVVRKCMGEFEKIMDNKMAKLMETFKEVHHTTDLNASLVQSANVLRTPAATTDTSVQQLLTYTIGKQLRNIVQELLDQSTTEQLRNAAVKEKLTPSIDITSNQNAKHQSFTTSSPVFKLPTVPMQHKKNEINSFTSLDSTTHEQELLGTTTNEQNEQTVQHYSVRRSKRLSMRPLDQSASSDNVLSQPQRRSKRLSSIKELFDQRRCNKQLAVQSSVAGKAEDVDEKERAKTSQRKSSRAPSLLNNSVIASYFETSGSEHNSSKKQTITKHKKAILNMLNTGSMKELQLLPQVGQKTAYQIVTQRTLNGKFKSLSNVEKSPIWRGNGWERFAKANMLL